MRVGLKTSDLYDWEFCESGDKAVICKSLNTHRQSKLLEAQFTIPGNDFLKDNSTYRQTRAWLERVYGTDRAEKELHRLIKARANSQLRAKVFLTTLTGYLNHPEDMQADFDAIPARAQEYPFYESFGVDPRNIQMRMAGKTDISHNNISFGRLIFDGADFDQKCRPVRDVLPATLAALAQAEKRINLKIPVPPQKYARKPGPT